MQLRHGSDECSNGYVSLDQAPVGSSPLMQLRHGSDECSNGYVSLVQMSVLMAMFRWIKPPYATKAWFR